MDSPYLRRRARTGVVLLTAALATGLAGCALGPNFHPPAAPADTGPYTPTPLPAQTSSAPGVGGASQRFVDGMDIPAQWWTVFRSPALDELLRGALARNPDLAAAEASLRQVREAYNAQAGELVYPAITGAAGAGRQKAQVATANGSTSGAVLNLYNASVNVSYTPDVFGITRRTLESAQAAVDYQRFQVEATYLALSANVVTAAIREASLRAQLQATRDVLEALTSQQNVIEKQFEYGAIPRTQVLSQRNLVAQTQATVPPLVKALAQTRHLLSVLAGRLPGEAGMPEFTLASLTLPDTLPVSLPSALVRQRPDIRASEELLHQASAQIGVATAAQYPQFTLNGSYGSSSTAFGRLFEGDNAVWSLTAGLTAPIFNGGALRARKRGAEAAYDVAAAQYRATLLTAFQNVADSLRALESDASALAAQAESESFAAETLALAREQYKLGAISYLTLLDAQRSYQQAHIGLVQAQATRYADTAALFQALGGGWWNRADGVPASAPVSTLPTISQNP